MGNSKSTTKASEREKKARMGSLPDESRVSKERHARRNVHSARASMSSQGNRKPILTAGQRAIIKFCLDNSKDDLGDRIVRRACERKGEFRGFMDGLTREQKFTVTDGLKRFLRDIYENMMDEEALEKKASEFGTKNVQYRGLGFKPDFFVCTAEAVTTECTLLDAATHTPSDTAAAWSELTTFVFTHVREGYYTKLRELRKVSNAFRNRQSFDVSSDSTHTEESRRSVSPNDVSGSSTQHTHANSNFAIKSTSFVAHEPTATHDASSKFLCPPVVY